MTLIVDNIVKTFGENDSATQVLKGINFEIKKGEFVILNGASGSGKTTLLTILGGLLSQTSGDVLYDEKQLFINGKDNSQFRLNDIGFIFQSSHLIPYLTVEEQLLIVGKEAGMPKKSANSRATQLLNNIGLAHRLHSYPHMLSGGEKQRVAITRAFMNQPKIILADEPTASLDAKRAKEVVSMISQQIKAHNKIGIMITHDTSLFEYADRVIELYDGQIINQ
ncbi:ABC transporter ATP-binding protein [Staphylococcus caprae]|uniref:ABC transporter ATP-binding protein n=1 Tax=Staphylococcus TaxID=1279 RepID=UPI0008A8AE62|nr:ABC transporter ATP-binding protein [Staphylococcus sp. HMSC62A08]OHS41141.1 hemin ABC transporter ATP-binding protein [Staphylococcus sp. HMSC62A08]